MPFSMRKEFSTLNSSLKDSRESKETQAKLAKGVRDEPISKTGISKSSKKSERRKTYKNSAEWLRKTVDHKLNDCLNSDQKYEGIINLISDPEFLAICYKNISGKPGNITVGGVPNETLDGLN